MYEDLIKSLRTDHDKYFARDMEAADAIEELCGLCASQSKYYSEAIAKYFELWAKQPRWILVTERLPEPEWYLVRCNEMLKHVHRIAYYYNSAWYENCNNITKFVTHWMPLPEPPKEE